MDKEKLCNRDTNGCPERDIFTKAEVDAGKLHPRIVSRYAWALSKVAKQVEQLQGKRPLRILEIGCSVGYGGYIIHKAFKDAVSYYGCDKDAGAIAAATAEYADTNLDFIQCTSDILSELEQSDIKPDVIIAFEVMEHVPECRDLIHKLKNCADVLLISTPYMEPEGFWGSHHKVHGVSEKDFRGYRFSFLDSDGAVTSERNESSPFSLMLSCYERLNPVVTCEISSKDRYDTTLPLTLTAVACQSRVPDELILYLDGEHVDLRERAPYLHILHQLTNRGVDWKIQFTPGHGQVANHQHALVSGRGDYIWRLDDDNVPNNNVLSRLLDAMHNDKELGAVGGLVVDPMAKQPTAADKVSNYIDDIMGSYNRQWLLEPEDTLLYKGVEHLYSSFLYRVEAAAHGYRSDLSKIGHYEEAFFTHEMFKNNWSLAIDTRTVTWHYRCGSGGIRSAEYGQALWEHDTRLFNEWMGKKVEAANTKYIFLDSGLGDHYMFKQAWYDIKMYCAAKGITNVIIAACYPEALAGIDVQIVSLADAARDMPVWLDPAKLNIYLWATLNNHKGSLVDVYRRMYIDESIGECYIA